jgi:hypothetical protein
MVQVNAAHASESHAHQELEPNVKTTADVTSVSGPKRKVPPIAVSMSASAPANDRLKQRCHKGRRGQIASGGTTPHSE